MSDDNVTPIPVEYRRPPKVSARLMYAVPEPSSEMVWEVCPYLRNCEPCRQCPIWEEEAHFGKVQRGCYGLAAEACRVVMAMQRSESKTK